MQSASPTASPLRFGTPWRSRRGCRWSLAWSPSAQRSTRSARRFVSMRWGHALRLGRRNIGFRKRSRRRLRLRPLARLCVFGSDSDRLAAATRQRRATKRAKALCKDDWAAIQAANRHRLAELAAARRRLEADGGRAVSAGDVFRAEIERVRSLRDEFTSQTAVVAAFDVALVDLSHKLQSPVGALEEARRGIARVDDSRAQEDRTYRAKIEAAQCQWEQTFNDGSVLPVLHWDFPFPPRPFASSSAAAAPAAAPESRPSRSAPALRVGTSAASSRGSATVEPPRLAGALAAGRQPAAGQIPPPQERASASPCSDERFSYADPGEPLDVWDDASLHTLRSRGCRKVSPRRSLWLLKACAARWRRRRIGAPKIQLLTCGRRFMICILRRSV